MDFRKAAVVALALMVLLSGCSALDGSFSDDTSTETDDEDVAETETEDANEETGDDENASDADENAESDDEEGEASTGDGESDSGETETGDEDDMDETANDEPEDDTGDATWSPPKEPNRPLEDNREDRIHSVTFVDKVPAADGEGYSNFNLEVVADTRMSNIDPPEHGTVAGEPYFFVKINDEEDKIVERTGQVRMEENGTFHIPVRPAGIEEYGNSPQLTVEVFLMDEDKDWDDIYASWGGRIHFNPETEDSADDSIEDSAEDSAEDEDENTDDEDGDADDSSEETEDAGDQDEDDQ